MKMFEIKLKLIVSLCLHYKKLSVWKLNFLGLSKIYMGHNFVDALGPRDAKDIKA